MIRLHTPLSLREINTNSLHKCHEGLRGMVSGRRPVQGLPERHMRDIWPVVKVMHSQGREWCPSHSNTTTCNPAINTVASSSYNLGQCCTTHNAERYALHAKYITNSAPWSGQTTHGRPLSLATNNLQYSWHSSTTLIIHWEQQRFYQLCTNCLRCSAMRIIISNITRAEQTYSKNNEQLAPWPLQTISSWYAHDSVSRALASYFLS